MAWRFWESEATRIGREAAAWRVEMQEPASQSQVAKFEAWLRSKPSHLRAFEQSDQLATLGEGLSRDREAATVTSAPRYFRTAYAVGVLAIVAIVGASLFGQFSSPVYAAISNHGESSRTVKLRDGSIVTLDKDTTLEVAVDPNVHQIRMVSGRARIVIHLVPGQMFEVQSAVGGVTATGAVIDVAFASEAMTVSLIKGSAKLVPKRSTENSVDLAAGRAVRVSADAVTSSPVTAEDASWTAARVGLDNTPLANVLAMANRPGQPTIEVANDAIGSMRVTAILDLRDTRALARKLAAALDLRVVERGASLILTR